ncbi:LPS assembly lipoprotein LptE [Methylocystis sp.]|uniref:LPS assembly lipoprotein LptE n=1 Tax=Methylocystis sp. TaxID=1911079 RepID=UPI003DA2AA24
MSLPERAPRSVPAVAIFAALAVSLAVPAGCTVTPLYSNASAQAGAGAGVAADLSSIAIKPVETRYAQEVRNHLIFLLNGGSGQPPAARYTLALRVTALNESAAVVQIAEENEPTAGTVTLITSYALTDNETGEAVSNGTRQISASYDKPRQEFAALRAQRDAEDRAARELAELLRLTLAQDLSRRP